MMRYIALTFTGLALSAAPVMSQVSGNVLVIEKENKGRKLAGNLLVWVSRAGEFETNNDAGAPLRSDPAPPSITSRNKKFEPRISAVSVGATLVFPNVDDIMHNVFSLAEGNRFDLGLYKSGAKKNFVFETPGLVRIYCNIHPQMSAFVHVMPNSYFAWAEPDGSFVIPDVPPGDYTLNAWHEEGEQMQPVVVTEQGANGVVVRLDVSDFKKRPHLNKFGKPYKRKRGKY